MNGKCESFRLSVSYTVKNVWSLFKRSVVGSYHKLSTKHLDAYLDELEWRFNNRNNPYLFRGIHSLNLFGLRTFLVKLWFPNKCRVIDRLGLIQTRSLSLPVSQPNDHLQGTPPPPHRYGEIYLR